MNLRSSASPRARRASAGLAATLLSGIVGLAVPALTPAAAHDDHPIHEAPAVVETTPSDLTGDSVDDPAIWVDPVDPTRSVVIAADHADKGLSVYDLTGERIHELPLTSANNVDLRPGFALDGQTVPLVALAGSGDLSFYKLDPQTRELSNITPGGEKIRGRDLKTGLEDFIPHGVCLYHSPVDAGFYVFVVDRFGTIKQFAVTDGDGGKVAIAEVREIKVEPRGTMGGDPNDALEGCVADDLGKSLFVGEQDWHIWRYGADPTDPIGLTDRVMVDSDVSEGGHFARDVEGLTLVNTPGGEGYLIGSSQGDYTYTVYRSTAPYEFVRKVKVIGQGDVDGCERTDGIDATALNLGPAFPQGMFICQDNDNDGTDPNRMNLKFVRLETMLPLGTASTPTTTPTSTTTPTTPTTTTHEDPAPVGGTRSGYWMLGARGDVYAFGDARYHGKTAVPGGTTAVDLAPTPSGNGYWVIDSRGNVGAHGDAVGHGSVPAGALRAGETATSLSPTRTGRGYWVFTTLGRVFAYGDAVHLGDMVATALNAPVLDSITTPSGLGYFMVAGDGGIFTFGDAKFLGSMGGTRLNQPVQSLVPDLDGTGYWLVASDGGVFSFDAPFRGSMAGTRLNRPVTGMVPFGNGYLMVAEDGGIFSFSDKGFLGSLGATPPADPITSTAVLD